MQNRFSESYFIEKKIGKMEIDTLDIGEVNLPWGNFSL